MNLRLRKSILLGVLYAVLMTVGALALSEFVRWSGGQVVCHTHDNNRWDCK
jgi:hypothetical protein